MSNKLNWNLQVLGTILSTMTLYPSYLQWEFEKSVERGGVEAILWKKNHQKYSIKLVID